MINTEPYDMHGDDNNYPGTETKQWTLEDQIDSLGLDYKDDLEGFINELSVIKISDEEKAHFINQYFTSIDMARVVYPLFVKCYENVKETQRLRDLINDTWNKSNDLNDRRQLKDSISNNA